MAISSSCSHSLLPFPSHLKTQFPSFPSSFSFRPFNRKSSFRVLSMRRPSKATVLTGQSWSTSILDSKAPVLVEFYASWCGPCQMVHRVIDEIAGEYAGKVKCYVLNADKEPRITEEYDIKAVPIVVVFKNGEKCESVVGTMPKEFYVAAIERALSSSS